MSQEKAADASSSEPTSQTETRPSERAAVPDRAAPEKPASEPQQEPDEAPDIPTIGEVSNPDQGGRCSGAAVKEWPLHNKVSAGKVTVVREGPPKRVTIDASAGGSRGARNNPFVYLNLKTGKKVQLTDTKALNDKSWDLAFKRVVIRSNSGDSGTGMREVARLTNTDLSKVTSLPADSAFKTDVYLDPNCKLLTDPLGTPLTAFNLLNPDNPTGSNSWYSYGGSSGGISPVTGHVYVIRRKQTGVAFKMQIISWKSGVYTLTWQSLQ